MAARPGMVNLIKRLRAMAEAGASDYAIGSVTFWSDDDLQAVLDRHRQDIRRRPMMVQSERLNGVTEFHDYYTNLSNLEEAPSAGSEAFRIETGTGVAVTPDTYNYDAGHFRFNANTKGVTYYVSCRTFNLNAAAAEVWETKAAHAAKGYGFSADGAQFNRQQVFEHCMAIAAKYRSRAGVKTTLLVRSDVEGC